jgi:hypothetical protein
MSRAPNTILKGRGELVLRYSRVPRFTRPTEVGADDRPGNARINSRVPRWSPRETRASRPAPSIPPPTRATRATRAQINTRRWARKSPGAHMRSSLVALLRESPAIGGRLYRAAPPGPFPDFLAAPMLFPFSFLYFIFFFSFFYRFLPFLPAPPPPDPSMLARANKRLRTRESFEKLDAAPLLAPPTPGLFLILEASFYRACATIAVLFDLPGNCISLCLCL